MKKVILFFPRPWPGREMAGRVPLSILHLHAYLKGEPFDVRIADERTIPDMAAYIAGLDGDILCFGISSFTGIQIANALRIAAALKAKFPAVPLVWGGWHCSSMPDQTIKHPLVDLLVQGQGEEPFRQLLHALAGGKPLAGIKGVSYKEGGEVRHNPPAAPAPVLEKLKLSYGILDVEKYIYPQPWGDRAIGVITSLGCPFKCGFCAVFSVYKCRTLYRSVDYVLEELDYLVERHRIDSVTFDDDNFFVNPARVREFCRKLLARPYRLTWDAAAHVGLLLKNYTAEDYRMFREAGCRQLYIGAESGSDEILDMIGKKATVAQTLEYVRKMREAGIRSFLSTMVCFPGVSQEDIYMTMNMIVKCRESDPDLRYRLFYYTPYPATPLYQKALDLGMKEPQSLEEWSRHTLRKFKAPWIKAAYRKQIKYFYFYYFPYSGGLTHDFAKLGALNGLLIRLFGLVFENALLVRLAKWRIRNLNFSFPADAWFVLFGQRLKSAYNHVVRKQPADMLYDYED